MDKQVYFVQSEFELGDTVKHKTHPHIRYIIIGFQFFGFTSKGEANHYSILVSDAAGQTKNFYPYELEYPQQEEEDLEDEVVD